MDSNEVAKLIDGYQEVISKAKSEISKLQGVCDHKTYKMNCVVGSGGLVSTYCYCLSCGAEFDHKSE